MKPQAKLVTQINGYKLSGVKYGGRWSFRCDFPDFAAKFDGVEDASEAINDFERRATAADKPGERKENPDGRRRKPLA